MSLNPVPSGLTCSSVLNVSITKLLMLRIVLVNPSPQYLQLFSKIGYVKFSCKKRSGIINNQVVYMYTPASCNPLRNAQVYKFIYCFRKYIPSKRKLGARKRLREQAHVSGVKRQIIKR